MICINPACTNGRVYVVGSKASRSEAKAALRNYLTVNPGEKIMAISKGLGWSLSHTEKVLTEIRTEVVNGHVLKAGLIGFKEAEPVQASWPKPY